MFKRFFTRVFCLLASLCIILTTASVSVVMAATDSTDNGWGYAKQKASVYSTSTSSDGSYGSVGKGEGFTVLGKVGTRYKINYSASGQSYKEGYVEASLVDTYYLSMSCSGVMNSSTTTYYYFVPSISKIAGSVSAGEVVSVLALNAGASGAPYYYIEYNTSSGDRKRGWVEASTVNTSSKDADPMYFFGDNSSPASDNFFPDKDYTIYRVPNATLANVDGSISKGEHCWIAGPTWINGKKYFYVQYYFGRPEDNIRKSGYILEE